jgi:hypothetical protein
MLLYREGCIHLVLKTLILVAEGLDLDKMIQALQSAHRAGPSAFAVKDEIVGATRARKARTSFN